MLNTVLNSESCDWKTINSRFENEPWQKKVLLTDVRFQLRYRSEEGREPFEVKYTESDPQFVHTEIVELLFDGNIFWQGCFHDYSYAGIWFIPQTAGTISINDERLIIADILNETNLFEHGRAWHSTRQFIENTLKLKIIDIGLKINWVKARGGPNPPGATILEKLSCF